MHTVSCQYSELLCYNIYTTMYWPGPLTSHVLSVYVCVIVLINDSAENLSAFLHRGLVYMTLHRWRQAMADFEAVIKLDRMSQPPPLCDEKTFIFFCCTSAAGRSWGYIYWIMKLFESYFSKDLFLEKVTQSLWAAYLKSMKSYLSLFSLCAPL